MIKITMVFESIIAMYIKCMYVNLSVKHKIAFLRFLKSFFQLKKMESEVYTYLKIHTSPGTLKTCWSGEGAHFVNDKGRVSRQ